MIWILWKRFVCASIGIGALLFVLYSPNMAKAKFIQMRHSTITHPESSVGKGRNAHRANVVFSGLHLVYSGLKLPFTITQNLWVKSQPPEIPAKTWMAWAALGLASAAWMGWDGRRRHSHFAPVIPWMFLGLASPILAAPFYSQFRPNGDLWPCRNCHSKHLLSLPHCPFCRKNIDTNLQTGELK